MMSQTTAAGQEAETSGSQQVDASSAILPATADESEPNREYCLKTEEIWIRDPFIYVDRENGVYELYAKMPHNAANEKGVIVYTSRDLEHWSKPKTVLVLPESLNLQDVWAPEVHRFKDAYYLFVTLTKNEPLETPAPVDPKNWPKLVKRGTWIFRAESPFGPFEPMKQGAVTPEEWMALDGTLWVEEGTPWMIFCHEWIQTIDGTIDRVPLRSDLSDTLERPKTLFAASSAPGVLGDAQTPKITDGPFFYQSQESGILYMIWSTFINRDNYCVMFTCSESGKLDGPWSEHAPLYTRHGGHGMLFTTLEGRLMLVLHQPNNSPQERMRLIEIKEENATLCPVESLEPAN